MESAPYSLLVVALLAYGYIVGCGGGVHRETRVVVGERVRLGNRLVEEHYFACACGQRIPYREVWR